MLKLELTVQNHELIPTKYSIENMAKYRIGARKNFYNVNYVWCNFIGGWAQCYIYYARKFNIGRSENDAIRTVHVDHGGEFYDCLSLYRDGTAKQDPQYMCHDPRLLTPIKQTEPETYYNGGKKELPSFLTPQNLDGLKEMVYFHLIWLDGVSSTLANNNGKKIVLHLNIFHEDVEDK
jgi:hypothetical protein